MSQLTVRVDGRDTMYKGGDAFVNALRHVSMATRGSGDGISTHDVTLTDNEDGKVLSVTKKGQRTGMPKQ
jgi:hypothetical protein